MPDATGRRPTIADVARACGVAPSTVSRAFSRPGRVNPETACRIREAARRLGYRTQSPVRLPAGRAPGASASVALVLSDVTNPVYFPVIRGAEAACARGGATLIIADAHESARSERDAVARLRPVVDGVLLCGSRMSDAAVRAVAQRLPVVVLNRRVPGVASVVLDNRRGMRLAVEHLAALGHTGVVHVAGPAASWPDGERWQALREAAAAGGLRARRLAPHPPTLDAGTAAAADLLRLGTTSVVAYNDLLALGLVRALAARGVRVPQDVSVVGFDDIFGADLCTPGLTTVAAPLHALGEAGTAQVLAQARSGTSGPTDGSGAHVLPVRLVVRGTTGPARPPHAAGPAVANHGKPLLAGRARPEDGAVPSV